MRFLLTPLLLFGALYAAPAAQPAQTPPPAPVVTETIQKGTIHPFESFVGTLKYATLSKLPAHSAAAVEEILAEAGQRVKTGQVLAVLDSAILSANLEAKAAELSRVQIQQEQAQKDDTRYRALFEQNSVSAQQYEQFRLKALELQAQVRALRSSLEALRIEQEKRTIRAPYDGVVIERHVSMGDWVSTGSPVVTLAREDSIELVVYLPAQSLALAQAGKTVTVAVAQRELTGEITAVVPKGDSASRTFPVRIALAASPELLAEGMEATARIAGAHAQEALLVHRDAVINRFGQNVLFFVAEGKAMMAPVEIIGYDGLKVAVKSPQLQPGMAAVIKGNERIFPGQGVKAAPQGR
ncbi:MAG: efflux RND transporter periplasmic adaptor subunit [Campylobacterales bacterium]